MVVVVLVVNPCFSCDLATRKKTRRHVEVRYKNLMINGDNSMKDLIAVLPDYHEFIDKEKNSIGYCYPSLSADDMMQEALMKSLKEIAENAQRWDSVEDIKTNLHVNVERTCIDNLRKKFAEKRGGQIQHEALAHVADVLIGQFTSPSQRMQASEIRVIVFAILRELKSDEKQLVFWRYYEKLTYHEISAIAGKTPGSLRVKVLRVLEKMEPMLREKGVNTTFLNC